MSVKQMAAVFELSITALEKLVLLAMADHARDDGTGCYPSIGTLAEKASLSRRGTQKLVRRLELSGLITDTGKKSRLGTIEYAITLGEGGEQGSLPFKSQGANARAKRGEPGTHGGANQSAQKGRTGFARTKDLTVTQQTKDGNGLASGGGCQDQEEGAETSAALARAFALFGFSEPFGHQRFHASVIKRAAEVHDGDRLYGNLLEAMERVIQDCDQKVPPRWYEEKHLLEGQFREADSTGEARVGTYRNDLRSENPLADKNAIAEYIRKNAALLDQAADKVALTQPDLAREFRGVSTELRSFDPATDLEELEALLVGLEEELRIVGGKNAFKKFGLPRLTLNHLEDSVAAA
jgi:hypothetical protein